LPNRECQRTGGRPVRHRILYIDDDPGMRAWSRAALGPHGFHVTAAAGNDEALALLRRDARRFDALVQDDQRPLGRCLAQWGDARALADYSGTLFLTEHVWRLNPLLPCLFVTGAALSEVWQQMEARDRLAFVHWLPKPPARDDLVAALREALAAVRGTMGSAGGRPLPWGRGPSTIVRYDQPVVPGKNVGDEWLGGSMSRYEPDERCCEMVLAGDVRLGEVVEVTAALLGKVLECGPDEDRDLLERLCRRVAPGGRARVGTRLFRRIYALADKEFDREWGDVCLETIDDEGPLDRGCCRCCRGEWAKALEELAVALSESADVRAYLCRARARHMTGDVREAGEDFDRYLASGAAFRRPTALAWHALALADAGNPEGALARLEEAIGALERLPAVRPAWANVITSSGIECWLGGGGRPTWPEPGVDDEQVREIDAIVRACKGRLIWPRLDPPEPRFHWFARDLEEVIAATRGLGRHAGLAAGHRPHRQHLENRLLRFRQAMRM